MEKINRKLMIKQLDSKISQFPSLEEGKNQHTNWIKSIRLALNMSLKQLASRLGVSIQNVNQLERRENEGTITFNKLREVATALDMKLVYGFLPNDKSLEKLIEKRAEKIAKEIVLRTSQSMRLEDQALSDKKIIKAIKEKTDQIKEETPRYLWD